MTVTAAVNRPLSWRRSRWFSVVIGVLVGGAVGLALYWASLLTGLRLYLAIGVAGGAAAALVTQLYASTIRLADVTVSVPQLSSLRFVVTPDSRLVAWRLFVETVTRVSLQPLAADAGLLREALNSLYALFTTTRELLASSEPTRRPGRGPTVEHLAISMLNREIRPFLSTWHPRLHEWQERHPGRTESEWPEQDACRGELTVLQQRLASYVVAFGRLAGLTDIERVMWASAGHDGVPGPISGDTPPPR